jgi:hypothetical protein
MGCNAWNHSSNCDCGWGGDTGVSPGPGSFQEPGLWWQTDRRPRSASYLNSNALCPVCGAEVFFFQSSFGGRVFFDHPGPPWPKHPCTDSGDWRASRAKLQSATSQAVSTQTSTTTGWTPLIVKSSDFGRSTNELLLDVGGKLAGSVLFLPESYYRLGPIFFKKDLEDPSKVVLSVWDEASGQESNLVVSAWYRSRDEWKRHLLFGASPSPEALNALGMSWSFAHMSGDGESWISKAEVNLVFARRFFTVAARLGNWAACNNLALLALNGLGRRQNKGLAVMLLEKAVRLSNEKYVRPLRNLASCYETGTDIPKNIERAAYLLEKAAKLDASK